MVPIDLASQHAFRILNLGQSSAGAIATTEVWMQSLAALPSLHTLSLYPQPALALTAHRILPLLPALTDLRTTALGAKDALPPVDVALHHPNLTSLHLSSPGLQCDVAFETFFTTPKLAAQLTSLTLEEFTATGTVDPALMFAALTSLTSLHLRNIKHSALWLSHAGLAPLLHSVRVLASANMMQRLVSSGCIPSEGCLEQMLDAHPRLHCGLTIVWEDSLFDDPIPNEETRVLDSLQERYSCATLSRFGTRFQLECKIDLWMTCGN